jgi:hypothetical protein
LRANPVRTSFESPWQNGVAERWVGSCRRDLLDHIIAVDERHLKRRVSEYIRYYHEDRTYLGLGKETPDGRTRAIASGHVFSHVRLGGLHHRYDRACLIRTNSPPVLNICVCAPASAHESLSLKISLLFRSNADRIHASTAENGSSSSRMKFRRETGISKSPKRPERLLKKAIRNKDSRRNFSELRGRTVVHVDLRRSVLGKRWGHMAIESYTESRSSIVPNG